jgi:Rrf2 family transcriptional regulator, cysteine metabolism repressor
MKITARVDYAVLAVFELALHPHERPLQAKEIAERQQIPLRFLEQILIQLKNAGLVKSVRGAAGGYLLARVPDKITLKNVVEAVDGEVALLESPLNPDSIVTRVWREIENDLLAKLNSLTVQDLVKRKLSEDQVLFYQI